MNKAKTSHQPIGACVIVLNNNQTHLLMGKRLSGYKIGYLGMPGGKVEFGEPVKDTAFRELFEETSLRAENLEFIGVIREQQESQDFIHFAFVVTQYTGNPTLTEPDKCEGWKWFHINKLPAYVLPGHKYAIELFFDFKRGERFLFKDVSKLK